ncbi:MAG: 4Fe-4S binding protein [Desulfobacteraceae bacterium]|nr:4Fe-4S binding protein [Desulfobacteraceae bacterium]
MVNSHYYAQIDPDSCTACGICAEERCQVNAIEQREGYCRVVTRECIGCGLCVNACPKRAISLVREPEEQIKTTAEDEMKWYETRAKTRGVDISGFL